MSRPVSAAANKVSIHRPHTRPDDNRVDKAVCFDGFNSQASYEARLMPSQVPAVASCFNSQASYEARLINSFGRMDVIFVSIHRPHTRPDTFPCYGGNSARCFNSQASYEARLYSSPFPSAASRCFNSQASYEARPAHKTK